VPHAGHGDATTLKASGLVAVGGSESAFATHFHNDTERWAAVIKAANIVIAP
jgi:hypothetical protein